MQSVIDVINELADEVGKPLWDVTPLQKDTALLTRISELAEEELRQAYGLRQKQARTEKIEPARSKVLAEAQPAGSDSDHVNLLKSILSGIEAKSCRIQILSVVPRIDGRDTC